MNKDKTQDAHDLHDIQQQKAQHKAAKEAMPVWEYGKGAQSLRKAAT